MKYQRGVTLSGLILWGIIIALVAILVMRVAPSAIDYYKTLKATKTVVSSLPPTATVKEVRTAYIRYRDIDDLPLGPEQLEVTKESGQIVINFSYEKRLPLFGPVSLLIEYSGSTSGS